MRIAFFARTPAEAPRAVVRMHKRLIAVLAGLLGLGLPAGYFAIGYTAWAAELQTRVDVRAEIISQAIGRSPQLWQFEELRLRELLVRQPVALDGEHARILSADGAVIVESSHSVGWLPMVRSAALTDAGAPVGRVEVRRSTTLLLLGGVCAAMFGLLIAFAVFAALRRLERGNQLLAAQFFNDQERARVTLHAITDAVITTCTDERVRYMNPAAERLTLWPRAEALGRPLAEVCPLIDEATMASVATPVKAALRSAQVCLYGGKNIALIRRDGSALSIEDSAAPIHDRCGAVSGAVLVFHDVAATRHMAQRITWAATHDALTGLVNRREFETRVETALLSARNSARHHAVCYLDLDDFKIVNDSCGHAAGDALLKELAAVLQSRLRDSDTLARLGGDEFGVLLEGCAKESAQLIAADLLSAVREHRFFRDGKTFNPGVSIGLVAVTDDTESIAEIFGAADHACYSAKEQGRNRVCVYQSSDAHIAQRRNDMGWATRLASALEQDRFVLYYQPYRALGKDSNQGQHIEILLRLIDEEGQLVQPYSFIPAAERYGLMPAVDRWVIRSVFSRHRHLASQLGAPLTCAINLSGTTLNSDGILAFIQLQAEMNHLAPGAVCFEVTEKDAIHNMRQVTEFIRDVKALGFSFALDDFGMGTSSLAYLKTLPVDYLKIEGSFIRNLLTDPIDRAMVDTINRVGHIMGLQTVAEFAESDDIIHALSELGIDFAQGFGVQRPRPLSEVGVANSIAADLTSD